ncbi:enoyl-CoA hydratase/isomerase family protein [Occultella glacieicola]|uniref:3-hydroxyisobutyryl-CoA hydrolase n=1 Tax=Occultella glacieicola TaxID=2518684 RepID=A0ABY2E481_9MICO|nr:enoyl-CoA hydratase/isomerase family protein [Occultella glacieicola]
MTFTAATNESDEVLVTVAGPLGRIRLNRPRTINALTPGMITTLTTVLTAWAADEAIAAVTLEGAGDRGLCSGADVRAIRACLLEGNLDAAGFFGAEYALNALISDFPKPYAAFMDGIVMGGGIGLSAHGSLRLVTERTRVAMPETGIGLFPDVGALFFLSRAPGELGTHLALTGTQVDGADAIAVGLADTLIPSGAWPAIVARLAAGESLDPSIGQRSPTAPLASERGWIDRCYAGDDPARILEALREAPEPAARAAGEVLAGRSPLSVAVSLAAIRRAAALDSVEAVLAQDLRVATALVAEPDFVEGVRAVLVDKDQQPHWRHTALTEVSGGEVAAMFGGA